MSDLAIKDDHLLLPELINGISEDRSGVYTNVI